jgi:VWFA-related protein
MNPCRTLSGAAVLCLSPLAWAAAGGIPSSQSPQLIPRTPEDRDRQYRIEHRVILTTHVSDSSGKPVPDLDQADFVVLDNQVPRPLADFRRIAAGSRDPSARLLFVLDAVNNTTRQLRSFAAAVEEYVRGEDATLPHPFAIGLLSGSRVDVGDFTVGRDVLLAELKSRARRLESTGCVESEQWTATPRGPGLSGSGSIPGTPPEALECMNSRFVTSVAALSDLASRQAGDEGPLALLWFGSGWPTLTNREFHSDNADLKRRFFAQVVDVTTALREKQISLHAVASPEDAPNPEVPRTRDVAFFAGARNETEVEAGHLGLHALAHLTGGRTFKSSRNVARQIGTCAADLDSFYLLSFDAPPAAKQGEYHALHVNVDKPGMAVRTSTLYYAEQ